VTSPCRLTWQHVGTGFQWVGRVVAVAVAVAPSRGGRAATERAALAHTHMSRTHMFRLRIRTHMSRTPMSRAHMSHTEGVNGESFLTARVRTHSARAYTAVCVSAHRPSTPKPYIDMCGRVACVLVSIVFVRV